MKLGNDFTGDNASDIVPNEESDQKESVENTEEKETEDSANPDNSENQENKESDDESNEEEDPAKEAEPVIEDKTKILQGLLKTEKELEVSTGDVDVAIAAAKQRISSKRKDRRDKRDLVDTIDKKFPEDNTEDDLSDIDPTTLEVLERFTKSRGLVPKSEISKMNYQEKHNYAQEQFYANHTEYLPENDPDDVLYNALKQELSYFSAPSDAKLIPALFAKAHRAVVDQYPDKFKASKPDSKDNNDNINKSVRIKTQGIGGKISGGGGSVKSSSGKTFSQSQIRALEDGGWSPEEIKELTK